MKFYFLLLALFFINLASDLPIGAKLNAKANILSSFSSYLLYTYSVPNTDLNTWNTSVYKTKDSYTHGNYLIAGRGRVEKQSINNKHNNKVNTECVRRLSVMWRKEKVDKASERHSIDYIVH